MYIAPIRKRWHEKDVKSMQKGNQNDAKMERKTEQAGSKTIKNHVNVEVPKQQMSWKYVCLHDFRRSNTCFFSGTRIGAQKTNKHRKC